MIDLNEWIRELDEEPDRELIDHEEYQKQLFRDYVLRKNDNMEKREELFGRFCSGKCLPEKKDSGRSLQHLTLDISAGHIFHIISQDHHLSFTRNSMRSGRQA